MDQSYPPSETTETDQPRTEERNAKVVVEPPVSLSDYHRYQAPRRGGSPLERTGSPYLPRTVTPE